MNGYGQHHFSNLGDLTIVNTLSNACPDVGNFPVDVDVRFKGVTKMMNLFAD